MKRVQHIRIADLATLPMPEAPALRQAAKGFGLLGPDMLGIALGHGIFIRERSPGSRLISHECRHVYQYEQAGSLSAYLNTYLTEVLCFGYWDAPMEVDARRHEVSSGGSR
ncbi:hypothetical protein [uncultured Spongiibacter sp.]|uniref:hypothetical protein n=1 Tax=uncultured Spongiibacter sp. TaxID=870896 RepID=UPI0025881711|nr:hypothetical protein [uncultured Spongiibacter sp.]